MLTQIWLTVNNILCGDVNGGYRELFLCHNKGNWHKDETQETAAFTIASEFHTGQHICTHLFLPNDRIISSKIDLQCNRLFATRSG